MVSLRSIAVLVELLSVIQSGRSFVTVTRVSVFLAVAYVIALTKLSHHFRVTLAKLPSADRTYVLIKSRYRGTQHSLERYFCDAC